ncbi:MAG: hypothetical protein M3Q39_09750 [Actinomycetota bacterium]|nr:hypothetical protein [Actinomycetota bacterium]
MSTLDLTTMTETELRNLYVRIQAELAARKVLADAHIEAEDVQQAMWRQLAALSARFRAARDRTTSAGQASEWVAPTKMWEAYWPEDVVTRGGKTWQSVHRGANFAEPGTAAGNAAWSVVATSAAQTGV